MIVESARRVFTKGWCHVFALALNAATGWPLYVGLDKTPEDEDIDPEFIADTFDHVMCMNKSGKLVDISGVFEYEDAPFNSYLEYYEVSRERLLEAIAADNTRFLSPFPKIERAARHAAKTLLEVVKCGSSISSCAPVQTVKVPGPADAPILKTSSGVSTAPTLAQDECVVGPGA